MSSPNSTYVGVPGRSVDGALRARLEWFHWQRSRTALLARNLPSGTPKRHERKDTGNLSRAERAEPAERMIYINLGVGCM